MAKSNASTEVENGKARRNGASRTRAQRTTRRSGAKPERAAAPSPPSEVVTKPAEAEVGGARPEGVRAAAQPSPAATPVPKELPAQGVLSEPDVPPTGDRALVGDAPSARPPLPATASPAPSAAAESAPPAGPRAVAPAPADAAASAQSTQSTGLLEGGIRVQREMLAYALREAERGVTACRAMLASRSLPEIVALQAAWLGASMESALRHGVALAQLTSDLIRTAAPRR